MDISLRVAVLPKPGSRAEKSVPNNVVDFAKDTHVYCKLEQKQGKAVRSFPTSTSERKSRKAKSKIDGSSGERDAEDSDRHGPDEVDKTSPLRPAEPSSHPPTSRREIVKKLRLTRHGAGPRNDPFSVYPIPTEGSVPHAVDIFLQVWAPRQVPPHLRSTVGNPLASQLFPLALQNAGFFSSVVAVAQTYEAAHHTPDLQPSREVLKHCGKALTKVRDQLGSPSAQIDDVAMVTILFLMGVHYLVGDTESFGVHLKGIHHMVDLRGGLDKLGLNGITKAMVLQIDNYWTLMTGTVSKFSSNKLVEKLEYPTHPFFPGLCASIATMPKGFRELALEAVLSIQMLQILERMSKLVMHVDRVFQRAATMQEVYFLLLYKPHLVVQDAYICLDAWSRSCGSKIEPALCYGLIAFSWIVMGQARVSPVYWRLVQNLVNSIEQVEPQEYEIECLIWLSMVAVVHCRGQYALSKRGDLLLDRLLQNHAYTQDWNGLEAVLRKFFWHKPLVTEWKDCWKAAIIRKSRRPSEEWDAQSPMTINSSSIQESPEPDTPSATLSF